MSTLRIEFHCHTIYSKDSLLRPADLLAACRRKGIDRVVITDHNTIAGARAAQALDPERVIVGEEILTQEGELLAAFVTEEVPKGLPAAEALARLRAQGAFVSTAHPFDFSRKGHWARPALERIVPEVDALETFNARCLFASQNRQAAALAAAVGLPGTAGSDAHTAWELGRGLMELPWFDSPEGLRVAISQAIFHTRMTPLLVRLASRYAVLRKKLGKPMP